MASFGWLAGVHYSPHSSDATHAAFACVLGMPWATRAGIDHWSEDPAHTQVLSQQHCEQGLAEWLAPWTTHQVGWQLWTGQGNAWKAIGAPLPPAKIVRGLQGGQAIRGRAARRLHALVAGHESALGFLPGGQDGEALTYPIVSAGVAQLAAPISDALLGASAVFRVARTDLPAGALIAALPVFRLADGSVLAPTGNTRDRGNGRVEFAYTAAQKTAGRVSFQFVGCVVECLRAADCTACEEVAPGGVTIRSRMPDRQLYAEVSRQFSPLRLWIEAVQRTMEAAPSGTARDFCKGLVRLLGCGEDELEGGLAVGSVYELVLGHDGFAQLFKVADHADYRTRARAILLAYDAALKSDADGSKVVAPLLARFADRLRRLGFEPEQDWADHLARRAALAEPLAARDMDHARPLVDALLPQTRKARAVCAAWLAAVLPLVVPPGADGEAASLALVARTAEALKAGDSGADPVVDDDVLRIWNGQMDYCPGYWEALHEKDDIAEALRDDALRDRYVTQAVTDRAACAGRAQVLAEYERARTGVLKFAQDDTPGADDPPLQIRYAPPGVEEQDFRGCILALRAGTPLKGGGAGWQAARWITTFSIHAPSGSDGFEQDPVQDEGNATAVLLDTQGATRSDGLVEQVAFYAGASVFAAPEAEEQPAQSARPPVPELVRRVPPPGEMPPLAYGLYYQGLRGTVDNAGVILEDALREPTLPGEPRAFEDIDAKWWPATSFRYLSRQAPGAPALAGANDWGVAQETRSFRAMDTSAEGAVRTDGDIRPGHSVAVLYGGDGYRDAQARQVLHVHAPSVSPVFMERWLAADIAVPANDASRWAPVAMLAPDEVRQLLVDARRQHAPKTKDGRTQLGLTHPAVTAIDVTVHWYSPEHELLASETLRFALKHLDGGAWLRDEHCKLSLERLDDDRVDQRSFRAVPGGFVLGIPKGMRAKVEAASVIPLAHAQGDFARLMKAALVADHPAQVERPYRLSGNELVTRRPPDLWVESLPDVPGDLARQLAFAAADFELRLPASADDPQLMSLRFARAKATPAAWIAGVALTLKRWQWAGYQDDFPDAEALADWLPLYAGTTDTMPAIPGASFTTLHRAAGAASEWLLGSLVMEPVKLPWPRPASHMGFVVRGVPRFASLLREDLKAGGGQAFVYGTVRGVLPAQPHRLAPPVWKEAIPLPQTVAPGAHGSRTAVPPGNLVVLQDPMYDTADTAAFGGVAERLELDTLATWQHGIAEIGPNPIFHASPQSAGAPAAQPRLELGLPFGLGYDRVVGGRPAQTGAVVRPRDSAGQWLLAKCRLRRYLVPDLVLGSLVRPAADGKRNIGARKAEDGWVPEDFAVYAKAAVGRLALGSYVFRTLPAATAAQVKGRSLVYLVTWHRDRFAEAEITWRPLVHLYAAGNGSAGWELLDRATPFAQDRYPAGAATGAPQPVDIDVAGDVHRATVSDFTDSRWLTFIGSFGRPGVQVTPAMQLTRLQDGNYELRDSGGAALPQLTPVAQASASLLLLFAPQLDLMRGQLDAEGGELVGVYAATSVPAHAARVTFDVPILPCARQDAELRGVVMQVQRRNVQEDRAGLGLGANQWDVMVASLFPAEASAREAALRFVPEYFGPLPVRQ